MALVKSVLFVDGENLVMRYQAMLNQGYQPIDGALHVPNVFVWHPNLASDFKVDILRIMYYTSTVGDDDKISEIKNQMAQQTYSVCGNYYGTCQIYPNVYKKPAQSTKSRLVDINIVTDIMRLVYTDAIDVVCLLSGDGDYLNLISDVMRRGKKMCSGALSSGLNPAIKFSVDAFVDLDNHLFKPKEESTSQAGA